MAHGVLIHPQTTLYFAANCVSETVRHLCDMHMELICIHYVVQKQLPRMQIQIHIFIIRLQAMLQPNTGTLYGPF